MALSRLVARPLLASMFVAGGVNAVRNADAMAARAKPVADRLRVLAERHLPIAAPDEATLVKANGAVHVLAGLTLATGRMPRLSALVLAGTMVPTTFAAHRFWEETDPELRRNQQLHFLKNASLLGGLLIAAGDTEGRPGVVWRTKHAVSGARDTVTAHLPG